MYVEGKSFPEPLQWSRSQFLQIMRHSNGAGLLIAMSGTSSPFAAGYSLFDYGHLLRVAVVPEQRRKRIGTSLLASTVAVAQATDNPGIFWAPVDEDNLRAQLFFRAVGWRCGAIQHERKRNLYLFAYDLI
jgi:ribosomal protein S18 acetylase RimI-like enzyme